MSCYRAFKSEKIVIFHLIKSLGRGGAEILLPETLRLHDRERFRFAYGYFLDYKNQVVPELESLGATVHCFGANRPHQILLQARAVARYAQRIGAHLIHAHLPLAGLAARLAGRMAGIPVIYTEHNMQERYHVLTRWANARTLPWCSRVLGVSNEVTASILRHVKRPVHVTTLLNGVNTERFNPALFNRLELRNRLGIEARTPVIGTVAVFREQKRLTDWLLLAQSVKNYLPDARFILIGDGPQEFLLKAKAEELGMGNCVYFPGRLPEVRPWLAAMDVFVMTSAFEGLPLAMLEAMSMELPIAATAVGGVAEVVRHEKEGFLAPKDEPQKLLENLLMLLQNDEKRMQMGKAARIRVVNDFSIERMAKELETVYRSVIAEA
ncbi:MAG: hypothetical protein KatS3mg032_0010 [Cyclobacteriaceae bacterium]|nr:MAG: hypothetical protein KatS3mg032_0010 [Cyclobacteriaceae bacterium]